MSRAITVGTTGFIFILIVMHAYAFDEVRSDIYTLNQSEVVLDGMTFPGLYYDIDDNITTEELTLQLSNVDPDRSSAILSDQPDSNGLRGVVYTTRARSTEFDFAPWGQYKEIRFFAEKYLAAYDDNVTPHMRGIEPPIPFLYYRSGNNSLIAHEMISRILTDDDDEQVITLSQPLKLGEGYQLAIRAIDADGKKICVELSKEGNVIDSKIIQPSIKNTSIDDETYYYKKDLGDLKDIVTLAVHFSSSTSDRAVVDGIFQISDTPISIKVNKNYGKMSIRDVDPAAMTITLDNKDNKIALHNDEGISLTNNLYIITADQDDINAANPLRYCICKDPRAEPEVPDVEKPVSNKPVSNKPADNGSATTNVEIIEKNITNTDEAINKSVTDEAPATKVKDNESTTDRIEAIKTNVAAEIEAVKGTVITANEITKAAEPKKLPGFDGIFVITCILATAYLIRGRK